MSFSITPAVSNSMNTEVAKSERFVWVAGSVPLEKLLSAIIARVGAAVAMAPLSHGMAEVIRDQFLGAGVRQRENRSSPASGSRLNDFLREPSLEQLLQRRRFIC